MPNRGKLRAPTNRCSPLQAQDGAASPDAPAAALARRLRDLSGRLDSLLPYLNLAVATLALARMGSGEASLRAHDGGGCSLLPGHYKQRNTRIAMKSGACVGSLQAPLLPRRLSRVHACWKLPGSCARTHNRVLLSSACLRCAPGMKCKCGSDDHR
jgi:hypothetical protein